MTDDATPIDLPAFFDAYGKARAEYDEAVETHVPAVRAWEAYERSRLSDDFVVDLDVESAGHVAQDAINEAAERRHGAERELFDAIVAALVAGELTEGSTIPCSPFATDIADLTIVNVLSPVWDPAQIVEVLLTADGKPIEQRTHSWDLDADDAPIRDIADDESVRYERWGPQGLRVKGTVHPQSRRLVDTM